MAVKGNPKAGTLKVSRREWEEIQSYAPVVEEREPLYTREDILRRMRDLRSDWQSDIDRGADMSRVIGSAGGIDQTYGDYYQRRMDQLQRYLSTAGRNAMQGNANDVQGTYSAIRSANNFLDDMGTQLSSMPTAPATLPSRQEDEDPRLMERVRNWVAERRGNDMPDWRERNLANYQETAISNLNAPQYEGNDAASAYFGYINTVPIEQRDPRLEAYYREQYENGLNQQKADRAQREAEQQQKSADWFAEHDAMYANITQNPDFAANIEGWDATAQFAQTIPEAEAYRNYMLYTPENMRNDETERQLREAYEASVAQQEADVFQMSDEQKQIYQYLRNTRGKRAAEEYKDYISYTINAESVNNVRQSADYGAEDNGWDRVGKTILSSPANVLGSGFGALDIIGQNIRNKFGEYRPIDYNRGAQETGEWAQSVREHTMDDMGDTGDFFYGVGTSMLDSWTALGIGVLTGSPQVGTALLGLSAARQGMQDAAAAGATDTQAVAIGLFNGVAEFMMENIGIDNLYSILTDSGVKGFKNILRTILGQSFAEASEEGLTTLANTMGDAVIMGDKSQINRAIAELVAQGMPEQEARYEAIRQWFGQLGMDMLAGGLSGAGSGGIGVGANVLANRNAAAEQAAAPQVAPLPQNQAQAVQTVQDVPPQQNVQETFDMRRAAPEAAHEAPAQAAEEVVEQSAKPTQAVSEAENTAQKTAPVARKIRAKDSKGASVEIVDAVMGQDSNIAFKTADGRTILADDLDTKGQPKTMRLVEAAGKLNEEGASGLVSNYDGGDVMPYVRSYDLAYREGMANEDMQSVRRRVSNLSDEAFQAAYRAGQIERTMNADTAEIRGGVIRSYTKQPTKNQARSIEALDTMFRAIGRTVEIVDSIDITDSNGNVIRKSGSNAQFDEATNRYKIALDAQDEALLNVAVHETIHDIEKNAKAEFDALRDLVFKWLEMNGEDIDTLRQRQRALMDGQSDAYYDAEIVANTVPRIFSNRGTFEQFVDKFMKEQPESEKRAFMRMVNRVLEFIKDALRKLSEYSSWAQVKQLRAQHDMLQAVRDQYFEALDVATLQEAQGEGETRDSTMDAMPVADREERLAQVETEIRELRTQEREAEARYKAFDTSEWLDRIGAVAVNGTEEEKNALFAEFQEWQDDVGYAEAYNAYKAISDRRKTTEDEQRELERSLHRDLIEREYSAEEAKAIASKAVRRYHTTTRLDKAAYLLTTGSMLDFSAGQGYRVKDHREISEVLDLPDYAQYSDGMVIFMNMGNIRLQTYGIDISAMPNAKQISALRNIIPVVMREYDGFTVDFSARNGNNEGSIEYPPGTSTSKILADIREFFETGEVPEQGSQLAQFRYSAKDTSVDVEVLQAENAQLRAANAELAAQMKRTKGVNLDERAIRSFAQKLVKREGSTFDADQLANSLSLIYDDMANASDLTDEDVARIIQSGTRLARQVLAKARYFDQDSYDADSAVREFLRDTAVEFPAEYDDAIKRMATNRTAYRAQTRGVLNIVGKGKGVSIDQLWQSGSEDFPTVFSENVTNPEDMVEELFVIAQGLKEDAYFGDNPYANDLDTAANILFLEMQAELMNIPRVQTLADKAAEAAKANRRAERAEARYEKKKAELADVRKRNAERRDDANRRKYQDRVMRTANTLYQWAAKPNSKNYIPETMRLGVVKMLRALDMEGRMVEEAPKPPTHPGENATKEQMSAYRARETVYKRRLEAYQTKTQAKNTQSILWEQRMLKFADEMQTARGAENGANSFAATTDPDLPDAIRNFFKENPHVHLATMNAAQMKELSQLLSRIEEAVTSENKRHAEYRDQTISQTAADTKTAWREREEANETVLGKISTSKLAMEQMDAMNTAHMLGGGAQSIIQELRDGEDVFIEHIEEANRILEPAIKKLDKKRLSSTEVVQASDGKYTHAIVLHSVDGNVTLTRAQVMSLYCLNKREQARGHLYGDGIVSTRDGKKRTYRLTEQQVQEACGHLTDTERSVADVMQNLLSTVCAEWGNEATMELYRYKKFREKFYFPISTVELGRDVAYDPNASETTIAQRGFSQNTQDNATNAIYIGDVLTVVSKHVADMAEYGAYLVRISDAMRWLNYRGYTDADNTNYVNVKAELIRAFPGKEHRSGKDADKSAMEVYITDLIRSINGGASRTGTSNAITRLAKGAAVGANVSVAIQQPASYARAGALLSGRDLAFAKAGIFSKKERELMYKYAPIARWKSYGFFQAGTGRNVEALLRGDDNFYQTVRDKQGKLAEIADNNTWLRLWNACKHEQKRLHPEMNHKSDEFYRLVGKRLSEVIDRTQVVDSPFHRAPIVNDPRYVTLTAFQTEVFKSFSVMQSCTYDVVLNPKDKKTWKRLGKGVAAHVAAQVLAGWLAAAWSAFIRDKDEEKGDELMERWLIKWGWIEPTGKYTRWEKFLVQGMQRSLGNLSPLRLHWIGNKVMDVIENGFAGAFFGNDSVDSSFFNAISKFIAESIKLVTQKREGEPTDPTKLIGYGLSAGSYGSGIGFATVFRDAQGIARLIKDIVKPEAYAPTMDDVFYYAEAGVNEDEMSQVLAAETAKVQASYPSYSEDKAERTARGNLRGDVTREYRETYVQAFIDGDKETMRQIEQFMEDSGLYIDDNTPEDAVEKWLRDSLKTMYLEAATSEERSRIYNIMVDGKVYTRSELRSAIKNWTE